MIFGVPIFMNLTVCPNFNEIISFYNMKGQTLGHLRSNCIGFQMRYIAHSSCQMNSQNVLIYELHLDKTGLCNYNKCLDFIWRGRRTSGITIFQNIVSCNMVCCMPCSICVIVQFCDRKYCLKSWVRENKIITLQPTYAVPVRFCDCYTCYVPMIFFSYAELN